jgi:hypothetical protein
MRWLDEVSTDLRKMRINERRDRARDRENWMCIVKEAKVHPGLERHRRKRSWLIYLNCMMMHGLANFKFLLCIGITHLVRRKYDVWISHSGS